MSGSNLHASIVIVDCYIRFLPSEHGAGFVGTFRRDLGRTMAGWKAHYGHLRGLAAIPDRLLTDAPGHSAFYAWLNVVVKRLRRQGVELRVGV